MKEEQEKLLRYIGEIFEKRRKEKKEGESLGKFPEEINHAIIAAGKKIRIAREERAMSVDELSLLTGLTPLYISQIELGEADPYMTEIYDLSKALDIDLSALFQKK